MADQSRREFIVQSTVAAAAVAGIAVANVQAEQKPNAAPTTYTGAQLGVAIIGTGNQGMDSVREISKLPNAKLIAFCDADSAIVERAAKSAGLDASRCFGDFREVLKLPDLDAVVIATPDHNHAAISAAAMRAGKHVYCEKPLCHSVAEIRAIVRLAEETKVITQLGIQIHSHENYRRVVELIEDGVIGNVAEVHIWNDRSQREYSSEPCEPPRMLNYDLWSYPLAVRPFQRSFHPYSWREWWHFANGLLGDVGAHFFDVVFWALDLKYPTKITSEGGPRSVDLCAVWNRVTYDFPARGKQPALKLHWYDPPTRPAAIASWKLPEKLQSEAIMFIGEKGMLCTNYGQHCLLPEAKFKDFKPPTSRIAPSPGHRAEWVNACLAKDQKLATAPFAYGALLSETALLGAVAFRAGKALDYDAVNMKFPNNAEAEKFLRSSYREGFTL